MPSSENEYVQREGTRDCKDGEDGRRTPKGDIASLLNRLRTDDDSARKVFILYDVLEVPSDLKCLQKLRWKLYLNLANHNDTDRVTGKAVPTL